MIRQFKFFQKPKPIRWVTGYGSTIPVETMSIDHIANIVRCMNGEGDMIIPNPYCGNSHTEWVYIFHNELNRRRNQMTNSEVKT